MILNPYLTLIPYEYVVGTHIVGPGLIIKKILLRKDYTVENIVAKGVLVDYNQFLLLLPQCFQKSSATEASESVKAVGKQLPVYVPSPLY